MIQIWGERMNLGRSCTSHRVEEERRLDSYRNKAGLQFQNVTDSIQRAPIMVPLPRSTLLSCLALLAAGSGPWKVLGHVTLNPSRGAEGGFFGVHVRVPHGCEGEETTKLEIQVPKGIVSVVPEHKPHWRTDIEKYDLDTPVPSMHGDITEGPAKIIFEAKDEDANLHPEFLLDFAVNLRLGCTFNDPDTVSLWNGIPTLWFKTTQTCTGGKSHEWHHIPKDGEPWGPGQPAPYLQINGLGDCDDMEILGQKGLVEEFNKHNLIHVSDDLGSQLRSLLDDHDQTRSIAIAAIVLACVSCSGLLIIGFLYTRRPSPQFTWSDEVKAPIP